MRLSPVYSALSITSLLMAGLWYSMKTTTAIAFFDKEAVQGQFIRQLAEIKATEPQVEQSTKRFNTVLNNVLRDAAKQGNLVILRKTDVLAGGVDITDEVRTQLSVAMRKPS
ncbi:type-F conjugative transfer system protein TrbI [Legionella massiliensis]|uniref:Type-F conjugative transfer system protein TrbI n=1 Tax=Legionella massiliensis TaxID=1034943 RepID=A0A078KYD5_9GAMM|nr:TrbI F-type domain-containing protein [Legionella massiliensis]CDZ79405.1 type-F conjugative transfer system protein TrbI [Legionella massiliensis]CEE15143.1 Type-F conjugative transfer system protein (TrbI_Ftype) [Legionella massiliensis]